MGVIDEIKERLDIVDVIGAYVPLKKAGRIYKGLCPFHNEKTPSFVVYPDTGTWHCFGACGTGGDLFTFVMRRENMEFGEALRLLAQKAGVELEPRRDGEAAESRQRERVLKVNQLAAEYFHYLLMNAPEAAAAREYLTRRGINEETRRSHLLGFSRDDWHALGQHLTAKGYTVSDLLDAGLVIERKEGGNYDRFRGRLMFPIRDVRGNTIGFGARALDDSIPKYMNSPQSVVFDKSGALYGIDQAKDAIRDAGLVVIVEGYMDALMAHQCGRKNVVASMGTALTDKQVRIIKKLAKKLVLAMDADTAGSQATVRGLDVAREAFDRKPVPVLTARGLVRYEDQLDAEIRVAELPAGLDPDEVLKEDVGHWDTLVAGALPVVEYYLRNAVSRFDLSSPKGKGAAAREVLPLIQEVTSSVERAHYLQQLAYLLRVDEKTLVMELERKSTRLRPRGKLSAEEPPDGAPTTTSRGRSGRLSGQPGINFGLEQYVLLLLLKRPDILPVMNAVLQGLKLEPLGPEDMGDSEKRALFAAVLAQVGQTGALDITAFHQALEPSLLPALENALASLEKVTALSDEWVEIDAAHRALMLRELRLRREMDELRFLHQETQAEMDAETAQQWGRRVDELTAQLVRIQKEKAVRTSLRGSRVGQTPL